jgi:hypothetical protein
MNTHDQQLEIGFKAQARRRRRQSRRTSRLSRARWWFSQMRRVVDNAIEWRPAPSVPPQQIRLPLAQGR